MFKLNRNMNENGDMEVQLKLEGSGTFFKATILATLIMSVLKLADKIDISWLLCLAPIIVSIGIPIVIIAILLLVSILIGIGSDN